MNLRFWTRAVAPICLSFAVAIALILSDFNGILLPAQAQPSWWSRFFGSRPPDAPRPRGSRGDDFCAVAPGEASSPPDRSIALRDRPTFVWEGNVESIEIWRSGGTTWEWQKQVTADDQLQQVQREAGRAAYRVTADVELEPNTQYEWRMYQPFTSRDNFISIPFEVVSAEQQAQIQQRLPAQTSGEAAVLQRADYLASQQLWGEFWREVLSIEPPSVELKRTISNTLSSLCPQINVAASFDSISARSNTGQRYRDFSITGNAQQSIDMLLESDDFQPRLMVLNSAGESIAEGTGNDRQSRLVFVLPQAGDYTVRATTIAPDAAGAYQLRAVSLW